MSVSDRRVQHTLLFHVSNIFQVGHFDQEISPKANYPDYLTLCERYFALLLLRSLKYFTSTATWWKEPPTGLIRTLQLILVLKLLFLSESDRWVHNALDNYLTLLKKGLFRVGRTKSFFLPHFQTDSKGFEPCPWITTLLQNDNCII